MKPLGQEERFKPDQLSQCNQDDADTQVFLHAMQLAKQYKRIMIITVDTDLVVIGLSVFSKLKVEELWIQLGTGINRKWIPIHAYASQLGENVCRALPFWYAFSGCDTTSQFAGRKKSHPGRHGQPSPSSQTYSQN